ncbi:MAG TPA: hypothetical protein VH539_04410 [Gemmatimonadaceae bacterium]
MRRRAAGNLVALIALWLAVACLDISSPVTGITAISAVITPSPSVVVNDTSRDTAGQVAPMRVLAFGPKGETLPPSSIVVQFLANDSTMGLRVDGTTGLAFGDSLSGAASVLATVLPAQGKGQLQTFLVPLPVVPIPDSGLKGPDTTFVFQPTPDSLSSQLLSPPLTVTVQAGGDTIVQKYVVEYQIVRSPPPRAGQAAPTVVLRGQGADSTVAVTNGVGQASLQLRVRPTAINTAALLTTTDTVVVKVRVQYRGSSLPVFPVDSFIIPIRATVGS